MAKDPAFRKQLYLLIFCTLAYTANTALSFITVTHSSSAFAILTVSVGILLGTVFLYVFFKKNLLLDSIRMIGWPSVVVGACLAIVGFFLYYGYAAFGLARIYPLTAAASILFLGIDLVLYRKKLSRKDITGLVIGVLIVFFGTFLAQSKGFGFDIATLPFVVGIILFNGIGYYVAMYKPAKYSTSSKLLMSGFFLLLIGIFLRPSCTSCSNNIYLPLATGLSSGFLFALAVGTEVSAVRIASQKKTRDNVLFRNFVNNFPSMDVILVLIISVLLNSYTVESLIGGALIIGGVTLLDRIR